MRKGESGIDEMVGKWREGMGYGGKGGWNLDT